MRRTLTMLIITACAALPAVGRADDAADFEAVMELPMARVLCMGAATFPEMLRFAFQAEPEGHGPPEVVRTSSGRRGARQIAPRPALRATAHATVPVLELPCIQG